MGDEPGLMENIVDMLRRRWACIVVIIILILIIIYQYSQGCDCL